jgi:hypothetical protein
MYLLEGGTFGTASEILAQQVKAVYFVYRIALPGLVEV